MPTPLPPQTVRELYQGRFFKIDDFMQEQLREARMARAEEGACCSCCGGPLCSCTATCVRCCRLARFTVTSAISFVFAVAPWVVSVTETTVMLVYYFTSIDNALFTRQSWHEFRHAFSFFTHVEDVVSISVLRGLAVLLAYILGTGRFYQRPYLYAAIVFAVLGVPYTTGKAMYFHYPPRPHNWPFLTLMMINLGMSLFHVLTANRVMTWARRRYHMGLLGFGYPWEREEAAVLGSIYKETDVDMSDADVAPETLADEDSLFVRIGKLRVHYKCWHPLENTESAAVRGMQAQVVKGAEMQAGPSTCQPQTPDVAQQPSTLGIVLVHGFGGGTFAWRHVGPQLAAETGCMVVAFDRPGFGLTSRPPKPPKGTPLVDNPYSSMFQTWLLLQLAELLHLQRIVVVGHADGAMAACMVGVLARFLATQLAIQATDAIDDPVDQPTMMVNSTSLCNVHKEKLDATLEHAWMVGRLMDAASRSTGLQGGIQGMPLLEEDSWLHAVLRKRSSGRFAPPANGSNGSRHTQQQKHPFPTSSPFKQPKSNDLQAPLLQPAPVQPPMQHQAIEIQDDVPLAPPSPSPVQSPPRPASACSTMSAMPVNIAEVCGIALLHPNLGEFKPTFVRLLSASGLGRRVLRPLLRSEIGEVSHRNAWYDHARITEDVLQLYKRPLRVHGWDTALLTICGMRRELDKEQVASLLEDVGPLQALVLTGLHDRIVPPHSAQQVCNALDDARFVALPDCGHLSHEEQPRELVGFLAPFCRQALDIEDDDDNDSGIVDM